jgi:hypothetical protein
VRQLHLQNLAGTRAEQTGTARTNPVQLPAIATEAGTAETPKSGSVHEGAGPQDIAQNKSGGVK